jgi:hypothetical protein
VSSSGFVFAVNECQKTKNEFIIVEVTHLCFIPLYTTVYFDENVSR